MSPGHRTGNLGSTTGTLVSTGHYRWIYTASNTDDLEQLVWAFSVVENAATRKYANATIVVDTTAVDFTQADRDKLETLHGKVPSRGYLTGTSESTGAIDTADKTGMALSVTGVTAVQSGLSTASAVSNVQTTADNIETQIGTAGGGLTDLGGMSTGMKTEVGESVLDAATSSHQSAGTVGKTLTDILAVFAGITSLAGWLRYIMRAGFSDSTALAEINSGGGTFSNNDALESLQGDIATLSGGGGSTVIAPVLSVIRNNASTPTNLVQHNGETKTHSIYVYQETVSGLSPVDMSSVYSDLVLSVADQKGKFKFKVDSGITNSGVNNEVINVPIPASAIGGKQASLEYAIRDPTNGQFVYSHGQFSIRRVPIYVAP